MRRDLRGGFTMDITDSAKCVCSPPLRSDPADKEGIWEGLANGTFTVLSSDHAPFNFYDETGKKVGLNKVSLM